MLGASPRLFLGHGPPSQRSASLGRQPVPSSCHQFSWLGGHRGGPGQALNYKGRQRASRGDVAVLSSALHSSLFACNVLPVLRARLLHLCVWDNTWPDSGLIHPERLMLCSRFLLLLSPAVAGQGHSSTVMSTCDWTKQFKGLRWFLISKIFYFIAFFGSLAWNKLNSSCSWSSFKWSCSATWSHKRKNFSHPVFSSYSFKYLSL